MQQRKDVQPRVEANQVDHFEGTHGVIEPNFQGLVDIARDDPAIKTVIVLAIVPLTALILVAMGLSLGAIGSGLTIRRFLRI